MIANMSIRSNTLGYHWQPSVNQFAKPPGNTTAPTKSARPLSSENFWAQPSWIRPNLFQLLTNPGDNTLCLLDTVGQANSLLQLPSLDFRIPKKSATPLGQELKGINLPCSSACPDL